MEQQEQDIEQFEIGDCCHSDERGWVLFPWEGRQAHIDPATLHVVHIVPGGTRGNHFHPRASEWLCPISGEGLLLYRAHGEGPVRELHMISRRLCVRIPPGIRHAVTNTGREGFILVAARGMDEEGDLTVREKV
jgi:oxalate decarboxylase/phosphoglucose isomerase-like protein (cupin superfamily)